MNTSLLRPTITTCEVITYNQQLRLVRSWRLISVPRMTENFLISNEKGIKLHKIIDNRFTVENWSYFSLLTKPKRSLNEKAQHGLMHIFCFYCTAPWVADNYYISTYKFWNIVHKTKQEMVRLLTPLFFASFSSCR